MPEKSDIRTLNAFSKSYTLLKTLILIASYSSTKTRNLGRETRKGRGGTHLKLHSGLIDALENFHYKSFLCLMIRDLSDERLFA